MEWFHQVRELNEPITDKILQEKALIFNENLGNQGLTNFRASNGWLQRLKKRQGIRSVALKGEKASADSSAARAYIVKFKKFLE